MKDTMKALLKLKPEKGLVMQEVPTPEIRDNEVLIKIKLASLCGTDLHYYTWDDFAKSALKPPIILGHEFMGEIVATGKSVTQYKPGMRVAAEGHLTCGICRNCRGSKRHLCPNTKGIGSQVDGAFAEFISIDAYNVVEIPASIPDEIASIADPLGNATHTVLAADVAGEDVLITGAGPVGLMATAIARKLGAKNIVITDLHDVRLDLAKRMGATYALNVKDKTLAQHLQSLQQEFNFHPEFTVGFEMSGHETAINAQLEALYPGAQLILLGIHAKEAKLDCNKIIFKGLNVQGIYGRKMFETWTKMIELLEAGLDVSPIITHHFAFDDYEKAFEVCKSGEAGKVIFHWW